MPELLQVKDLETIFHTNEGIIHAVNSVSFHLKEGETLGIVGESGCGKSVTVMSLLHLIPTPPGQVVAGQALYAGQDLLKMKDEEIRHILGAADQHGFPRSDDLIQSGSDYRKAAYRTAGNP